MHIYICTTFREFDGSENDKIQRLFLKSLTEQTFQEYTLVVTTFGEKSVERVVKEICPKSIFYSVELKEYRFSLTDVLLNGIGEAKRETDSILVWCTCDLQLEKNTLELLVGNYKPKMAGIIHPNLIYADIDALKENKGHDGTLRDGIDFVFFSADFFTKEVVADIVKYRYYNWGVFEHFMVAIAMQYAEERINLYPVVQTKKVINDRAANNETEEYFQDCLNINFPVLRAALKEYGLSSKIENNLYYCHKQYKPVGKYAKYYLLRIKYLVTKHIRWKIKLLLKRIVQ